MNHFGNLSVALFHSLANSNKSHHPTVDHGGLIAQIVRSNFSASNSVYWSEYASAVFHDTLQWVCIILTAGCLLVTGTLVIVLVVMKHCIHRTVAGPSSSNVDKDSLVEEVIFGKEVHMNIITMKDPGKDPYDISTPASSSYYSTSLERSSVMTAKPSSCSFQHKMFWFQFCLLGAFILCTVVFIVFSFIIQQQLMTDISSTTSASIKGTIQQTFSSLSSFFTELITTDLVFTKMKMGAALGTVSQALNSTIDTVINNILDRVNVNVLIRQANVTITSLDTVINSMAEIKSQQTPLIQKMALFTSALKELQSVFNQRSASLCRALDTVSASMASQCWSYQQTLPRVTVNISPEQINFDSVTTLLLSTQLYKINITILKNQLQAGREYVNALHNTTISSTFTLINVDGINETLTTSISAIQQKLGEVNVTLSGVDTTAAMQTGVAVALVILVALIFLPTILLLFYYLLLVTFMMPESIYFLVPRLRSPCAWMYHKFCNKSSKTSAPVRVSSDPPMKPYSSMTPNWSFSLRAQHFSFHWYYRFSLMVLLLSILLVAVMVVLFLLGGFIETEICQEVTSSTGLQTIDNQLDIYFSSRWDVDIKQPLVSQLSLPPDLLKFLHIPAPQNITQSLLSNCQSVGGYLLPALGYTDVVDFNGLASSPLITNLTTIGKSQLQALILQINVETLVPKNVEDLLATSQDLIKQFVDGIDYNRTLTVLSTPYVTLGDASVNSSWNSAAYFQQLETFISSVLVAVPQNSDAVTLSTYVNGMTTKLSDVTNSLARLNVLYVQLQNNRNIANSIRDVMANLKSMQNSMSNTGAIVQISGQIFDLAIQSFLSSAVQVFSQCLEDVLYGILKCPAVNDISGSIITNLCQHINFHILTLPMELLFTLILFYFTILLVCAHLGLRYLYKHRDVSTC